jgi:hypothetical protein
MLEIIVSVGALVGVLLFGAVRYRFRRSAPRQLPAPRPVPREASWQEAEEFEPDPPLVGDASWQEGEEVKRDGPQLKPSRKQDDSAGGLVIGGVIRAGRDWILKYSPDEVFWQDIRAGLCAFDPPPKMKVARSETIAVRVSPQDPDDFVAMAKMVATLYRPDEAQIEPIEVGRLMRARLHGEPDAFDITPLSSEDQLLELNKIARWDFSVRPKLSGQRWLQLVISVRVPEDGRVELRDLPALHRTIKVEVAPLETLKQFAAKRGEFIADKVLIPLIILFAGALGVTAWLTGLLGGSQPPSVSPPAVPTDLAIQEAPAQSSSQKSPEQ